MVNKLKPPPGWGEDSVTKFFEAAKQNSYATFYNGRKACKRLIEINDLFYSAIEYMENSEKWFALLFFLKTHSAFLGALRLASATQIPEAYMVLRGALENSLYGWYIHKNEHLKTIWLNRHKSESHKKEVKDRFKIGAIFDLLEKDDVKLGHIARKLYERCVDFGAHPNERSLSASLKMTKTDELVKFDLNYLTNDSTTIMLCLKTSAQVGVLCLKILQLIIPERFKISQLDTKLTNALKGL